MSEQQIDTGERKELYPCLIQDCEKNSVRTCTMYIITVYIFKCGFPLYLMHVTEDNIVEDNVVALQVR